MITLLYALPAFSQALGQDSEGNSTVVAPSVSFNLDLNAKKLATFNFYRDLISKKNRESKGFKPPVFAECIDKDSLNLIKECIDGKLKDYIEDYQKNKFNFFSAGGDLKAGTKEGIGTFFAEEKLASSAYVGVMVGYNILNRRVSKKAAEKLSKNLYYTSRIEDTISSEKKKVTPDLLARAARITGYSVSYLKLQPKADEIQFYEGILKDLSDTVQIGTISLNKKKEMDERITRLGELRDDARKIIGITLEIEKLEQIKSDHLDRAGVTVPGRELDQGEKDKLSAHKQDVYKLYLSIKPVYPSVFSTEVKRLTFVKKDWEETLKSIVMQLELDEIEANHNAGLTIDYVTKDKSVEEMVSAYSKILELLKKLKEYKKENGGFSDIFYANVHDNRWLLYFKGAFTGNEFRYDLANNAQTIDGRFADKTFNGSHFELGFTYTTRQYNFLGFSAAVNYSNNMDALTPVKYKLDKTDPVITDGKFSTSEEIKALSGLYDTFLRYDLNFDFIRLLRLSDKPGDKEDKSIYYLSINPYIRHRIYENSDTLKNNTILGLGVHAYNSKDNRIMGGLFVQANDTFGVNVKVDESSSVGKRITFGVIVKFSLKGLKVEEKK